MKNYTSSSYALNKYSGGIVYRFADGIAEVALADYLTENPGKTEADFQALKEFSDTDYHEEAKASYRQTWKDLPDVDMDAYIYNANQSAEDSFFAEKDAYAENEGYQAKLELAGQALCKLTEVQRRRFLMHRVEGLTTRQIAEIEGVNQSKIVKSLALADKKIKKFLASGKK